MSVSLDQFRGHFYSEYQFVEETTKENLIEIVWRIKSQMDDDQEYQMNNNYWLLSTAFLQFKGQANDLIETELNLLISQNCTLAYLPSRKSYTFRDLIREFDGDKFEKWLAQYEFIDTDSWFI